MDLEFHKISHWGKKQSALQTSGKMSFMWIVALQISLLYRMQQGTTYTECHAKGKHHIFDLI